MIINNPRKYGNSPYSIILVHGGPGAPGEMAPIANELSKKFGVLEPLQTKSSVNGQVEELRRQVLENANTPVVLIGWSWGAWLSFIMTAKNPNLVSKLILVSGGPFEESYAKEIMPTRMNRLSSEEREKVQEILKALQNKDNNNEILEQFGQLMDKADTFDPVEIGIKEKFEFQPEIYEKVWREAARLRISGKLLKLAKHITCPIVAIHGDYDPHPYLGVKDPLSSKVDNFRFILLKNCGHTPWKEKQVRNKFYEILMEELK